MPSSSPKTPTSTILGIQERIYVSFWPEKPKHVRLTIYASSNQRWLITCYCALCGLMLVGTTHENKPRPGATLLSSVQGMLSSPSLQSVVLAWEAQLRDHTRTCSSKTT